MAKNQKYKQSCFGHSVIEIWNLFEIWSRASRDWDLEFLGFSNGSWAMEKWDRKY
jgi:hypothetical protein